MFEDTKFAVKALVRDSDEDYREGLTELITALANVHEYLHQQVTLQTADQSSRQVHAIEAEMEEYVSRRAAGQGNA
jgi:soluble cytochrome b562